MDPCPMPLPCPGANGVDHRRTEHNGSNGLAHWRTEHSGYGTHRAAVDGTLIDAKYSSESQIKTGRVCPSRQLQRNWSVLAERPGLS